MKILCACIEILLKFRANYFYAQLFCVAIKQDSKANEPAQVHEIGSKSVPF